MLNQHDETTLARIGNRLRVEYLVQQAHYTLEVAHADGAALWALLPDGAERNLHALMLSLERRWEERNIAEEESRIATMAQNDWIARGKVWRRKVVSRAKMASRLGKELPDKLLRIGRADTVQPLLMQMTEMVHLLEQHATDMATSVRDLVAEGRDIIQQLSTVDAKQEAKRLAELPQAVRAFQADKGRLYLAIKAINDAGRELHADDSSRAARYNLSILHRRPARSKSGTEAKDEPANANAS